MIWNDNIIKVVNARQYDGKGMGLSCAKCGRHTTDSDFGNMSYISRIPITQGGKVADNCMMVCSKCFDELGQDGTKTIPVNDLQFFDVRH